MAVGEFWDVAFPWPDDPSAQAVLNAGVALGITVSETPTASEIGKVSVEMGWLSDLIERCNPNARIATKRKAAAITWGYWREAAQPSAGNYGLGGVNVNPPHSHANAFQNSGAKALLSRGRVWRAGAIKSRKDDD